MKKIFTFFFAALFLQATLANAAISAWKANEDSGAKTRLIASFYENDQGEKKLIAGVEFKLAKDWKIYGQGSENIGMPPALDFSSSKNYSKHQIFWPQADQHEEKIGNEIFKYSSYQNEIILPVEIDLTKFDEESELTLKLDYGICKDVCIPVSESFTVPVPNEIDQNSLALIQKFYPQKIANPTADNSFTSVEYNGASLTYWILIAIIGGAILNIMPCVLPILSIKLLSIIDHHDTKISRIRFAFLSTMFGIVLCFLFFAICAALIKFAGNSFGWGLQFQNPYFLIFLIMVLILFIANLLGIFEITFDQFILNLFNKKITKSDNGRNIFIPNFLSGILAVLLATPCSAPILGSAISFALTQNLLDIFLIFGAIGIGFASPYLLLLIAPKLVYLLPKPGKWMLKVKKVLAFLLALTTVWLCHILSHNIGVIPSIAVTILVLLLLLCFEIKSKFIKYLAFAAVIVAAFAMPRHAVNQMDDSGIPADSVWIKFDEKQIHQLIMEKKVVVVDVTADWCLTCKVNKITVLHDKEVMAKLSDQNIVTMRADITKPDPEVMTFLRKHNRFAIPFNAIYGPNAKNGLLTSELLTKKQLLELIEQAK